jgi:starvation-inducible DNA-binding protein
MTVKYPTKNDLAKGTREKMADLLNANLADAIDLALQAKQAHWNVKGPSFIALHELFDKVRDEVDEWVDLIAERAVILGGVADGTLLTVSQKTRLPAYGVKLGDGRAHVEALSDALAGFGKTIREAIEIAASAGDADTADLFTEVSRGADKMLWFVEAHLHAER